MDDRNSKVWQATLTPHRSLTREGFYVLMGLVILVNLVVAGMFVFPSKDGFAPVLSGY